MDKEDVYLCTHAHMYTHTDTHTDTHTHTKWNTTQPRKKQNKILPFATIWMGLEDIMQNEVSQMEKDKYHMISLICRI